MKLSDFSSQLLAREARRFGSGAWVRKDDLNDCALPRPYILQTDWGGPPSNKIYSDPRYLAMSHAIPTGRRGLLGDVFRRIFQNTDGAGVWRRFEVSQVPKGEHQGHPALVARLNSLRKKSFGR
jgi:hypothetical protein